MPFVNAAADGKPSISPSLRTSTIVANCLLYKASEGSEESTTTSSSERLTIPIYAVPFICTVSIPADTTREPAKISP